MAREEGVDLPAEFESILRAEMGNVPSAAFLPRVRQRVAAERMRASTWTWRTLVPAGALAAAAGLAIAFTGMTGPVTTPPPPERPVLQTLAPISRVMPLPANYPVARERPRPSVSPKAIAPVIEPAVIIDERQRAALNVVLRMVQQGRLTEAAFAATVPTSLEPIKHGVVRVGVNALAVSAIQPGGVLPIETDKQRPRP